MSNSDAVYRVVDLSSVRVNGRLRHPDPEKVNELAASIKEVGLLHPAILSSDGYLLAGGHRLAALKLLGLKSAEFKVVSCAYDSLEAGLIEIDENLSRKELTVLEQAEYLLKRDELLKQLGKRKVQGDNQYSAVGGDTLSPPQSTFDIAKSAMLSERTTQRRLQIARNLTQEQRELIRKTPLANEQKELLEIAKIKNPERRTGVIKLMVSEKPPQTVNEATRLYRIETGEITPEFDIIKPSNWWVFGRPKWLQEGFKGGIPGEVYANALYYFGPQRGIAVDGMAGSGMLRRVYEDRAVWQRNRQFDLEIRLYDMYPREPFASRYNIRSHNMLKPLPSLVDWLFIDPPYFRMASHLYEGSLAATRDYSKYHDAMQQVISAAHVSVKEGGVFCLLTTAYMDITEPSSDIIDVPADMSSMANSVGFKSYARVYVSRGEQQRPYAGYTNIKAKMNLRMFSDVCELLVFRKGN